MSPGVAEQLKMVPKPPRELTELCSAKSTEEISEILLTMPSKGRLELAKLFEVAIGKKRAKTISLRSFNPKCDVVWDRDEVTRLVQDFEDFISEQWEDGTYLRFE
jgi:hypothetical protein